MHNYSEKNARQFTLLKLITAVALAASMCPSVSPAWAEEVPGDSASAPKLEDPAGDVDTEEPAEDTELPNETGGADDAVQDDVPTADGEDVPGPPAPTEEANEDEAVSAEDSVAMLALESEIEAMPQLAIISPAQSPRMAIDIPGASMDDWVRVQLYQSNATAAQRFSLQSAGEGYYFIKNINSGKALDVASASTADGTAVQQHTENGTDAQKWRFSPIGDGSYYIVSKLRTDLVLEVQGGSVANGSALQVRTADESAAQKFNIQGVTRSIENGFYEVKSFAANTVMDVFAAGEANGTNIQMYERNGTAAQIFDVRYDDSTGYYSIGTFASGKKLDVAGAGKADGANVWQYEDNGTWAQRWSIEASSGGQGYVVTSACSGLALDVYAASPLNGANVQTYSPNGTAAQSWSFGTPAFATIADGIYSIGCLSDANYTLDIANASMDDCANAQIYAWNNTWAQKFRITTQANGYCTIEALSSGKMLDVAYGGVASGTNVHQYTANGSDAQLWRPVSYGGSVYAFQSKLNGLYLDVASGVVANGSNVQVWTGNGSPAQKFLLRGVDTSSSISEGAYVLKSRIDGRALDIQSASRDNGAIAQVYDSNGTYAQKFKALSAAEGSYYLVNVHSSKYLDVDTASNTKLQQWDRTANSNQMWTFYPIGPGQNAYYVKSNSTGQYLTNMGGSLQLASYAGTENQAFSLEHTAAFKVYLDAGHGYNSNGDGGVDPGACSLGYRECDLNSDLVSRIGKELDRRGIEYYVGYGKAYWDRHHEAVDLGCSTFLSIHFNSGGGWGTESYIHSYNAAAGSPAYQDIMHRYLITGTGLYDRGQKRDELAVCGGRLPSVLCEIAFIDNWSDMSTYEGRKNNVASFIAAGLAEASCNGNCGWY